MSKISLFKGLAVSIVVSAVLVGCGGSGSSSTASGSGVVSDPYIENAKFYVDENNDGVYTDGEALSSFSDENGTFTFTPTLADGTKVIMDENNRGTHQGEDYVGPLLKGEMIDGNLVATPLTTMVANGFSAGEIVELLASAGITITAEDVFSDPMAAFSGDTPASEEDFPALQAAIAINTFLKMNENVEGGITPSNIETYKADITTAATLIKDTFKYAEGTDPLVSIKAGTSILNYITKKIDDDSDFDFDTDSIVGDIDGKIAELVAQFEKGESSDGIQLSSDGIITTITKNRVTSFISGKEISAFDTEDDNEVIVMTFYTNGNYMEHGYEPDYEYICNGKWAVDSDGTVGMTCEEDSASTELPTFTDAAIEAGTEISATVSDYSVAPKVGDIIEVKGLIEEINEVDVDSLEISHISDIETEGEIYTSKTIVENTISGNMFELLDSNNVTIYYSFFEDGKFVEVSYANDVSYHCTGRWAVNSNGKIGMTCEEEATEVEPTFTQTSIDNDAEKNAEIAQVGDILGDGNDYFNVYDSEGGPWKLTLSAILEAVDHNQ